MMSGLMSGTEMYATRTVKLIEPWRVRVGGSITHAGVPGVVLTAKKRRHQNLWDVVARLEQTVLVPIEMVHKAKREQSRGAEVA